MHLYKHTTRLHKLTYPQLTGSATVPPPEDAPRQRITESVASDDSNKTIPNGDDSNIPSDPVERQNLVIEHLTVPKNYVPLAAYDYGNEVQEKLNPGTTPAYAKIAAREWCFFVKKPRLLIGRADSAARPNPPTSLAETPGVPPTEEQCAEWGVDIDLGPDRQVSRVHAEIQFDVEEQTWFILVNSRNGLKLDDMTLGRGGRAPLHSGICINILGTQMLFLLADSEDRFHPMLWRQIKYGGEQESDGGGHNPPHRSLPHAHPSGPTPKRENRDPFPPSSHPRNQYSTQSHGNQLTSTPGRPDPGTPLAFRSSEKPRQNKFSPSSSYPRGMMLDSVEDVDYSVDASKDLKPPFSYAQLIGQAIFSSTEEMLTLANIYGYIKEKYAFYRHSNTGWQNSIRHNLSLSKYFEKVARRTDEPGKGMKWRITDSERDEFVKKQLFTARKPQGRFDSSDPTSPALRDSTHATERLVDAMGEKTMLFTKQESSAPRIKSPPRSATPPLISYPIANESFTPDRGPRLQHSFGIPKMSPKARDEVNVTPAKRLFEDSGRTSGFAGASEHPAPSRRLDDQDSSPIVEDSKAKPVGLRDTAAHSPPPLFSDTSASNATSAQDSSRPAHAGLITPLVTRHAPRLAPPSTAQVPSHYMNFSSPAPFWKFVDLPSTPAKAPNLDLSPIKLKRDEDGEPPQPSSPPIAFDGDDKKAEEVDRDEQDKAEDDDDLEMNSPSRTLSRPVSHVSTREGGERVSERAQSSITGLGIQTVNGTSSRSIGLTAFDDEEEGTFDLAKSVLNNSPPP